VFVVRMTDNRRHKRIMTRSPEGRRRRGRPEVRWEEEGERVMTQKNLMFDEPVNHQPYGD